MTRRRDVIDDVYTPLVASDEVLRAQLLALIAATSSRLLPAGGAAGEVLTKNSGTDYDCSWAAAASGGNGFGYFPGWGTGGQEQYFPNGWT